MIVFTSVTGLPIKSQKNVLSVSYDAKSMCLNKIF